MKKQLSRTSSKPGPKLADVKPIDRGAVLIDATTEADRYPSIARTLTRPEVGAAAVIEKWSPDTHDVNALTRELAAQVDAVNRGDMQRVEGMLLAQAQTLDAIFVNLMRRSTNQTALLQWETYMRMGMKAQSQCRATLQVLAEMKNPRPVAFVKQANINNGGSQQINNSGFVQDDGERSARAREKSGESEQSKLIEEPHDARTLMDTRTTESASQSNQKVEAMGAINRPNKPRR